MVPLDSHADSSPSDTRRTLSDTLLARLFNAGVRDAYGLLGGGGHPFFESLQKSPIEILHFRHEAGACFAAIEHYFASGNPAVVFTTTGPGLTNALTGMAAARRDGAKLVVISAATGPARRGRWAFQETSAWTMGDAGVFHPGQLCHLAARIESPQELPAIMARLDAGLAQPGAFVAHLSLAPGIQSSLFEGPARPVPARSFPRGGVSDEALAQTVRLLEGEDVVLWLGFGARNAWREVRALADQLDARVMCTPRAKGIFPGSHERFIGVTGLGGHASVISQLDRRPAGVTLVLGSRLGEMSSFWREELVPRRSFVHVDIDPEAIGTAYPDAPVLGIPCEIGEFARRLLLLVGKSGPRRLAGQRPSIVRPAPDPARPAGLVRPAVLMAALQRQVVDRTKAVVLTEAGNSFVWGSNALTFENPHRYRTSMSFGSMGHATTGVLGAARATGRPAVAVVGDGAMLMNNELNTAVHHRIPAIWVVLNDGAFGLVDHGMRSIGFPPADLSIPRCDFEMIGRGMGARGITVKDEVELDGALIRALESRGPCVVDVWTDPSEPSPFAGRGASIERQGSAPSRGGAQ